MAIVKLNEKVSVQALGEVATIDQLDKRGMIDFVEHKEPTKRTSGYRVKYFAQLKGADCYWQISKASFLSRTGKKPRIDTGERLVTPGGLVITQEAINSFNQGVRISYNDKENAGVGTLMERLFLNKVAKHYGVAKLSHQDIKQYLLIYGG